MRIYTYASGSEELPLNERAIARIKTPMPTGFGKSRAVRDDWHPVIFHAATMADAQAKAQAWWDAELAKELATIANAEKRAAARAAAKALRASSDPHPLNQDA